MKWELHLTSFSDQNKNYLKKTSKNEIEIDSWQANLIFVLKDKKLFSLWIVWSRRLSSQTLYANHISAENNDAVKIWVKGLERSQTVTTTITSALDAYAINKIINQCGLHVFLRPSKAAGERMGVGCCEWLALLINLRHGKKRLRHRHLWQQY